MAAGSAAMLGPVENPATEAMNSSMLFRRVSILSYLSVVLAACQVHPPVKVTTGQSQAHSDALGCLLEARNGPFGFGDMLTVGYLPTSNDNAAVTDVVIPESILFASGSDEPGPGGGPIIDALARCLLGAASQLDATVLGHTDSVGSVPDNLNLSLRRATAVITALVLRGVDARRLSAVAIGMSQPIASNDTEEGRERNRRVEILVSNSERQNVEAVSSRRSVGDARNADIFEPTPNVFPPVLRAVGQVELGRPDLLALPRLPGPAPGAVESPPPNISSLPGLPAPAAAEPTAPTLPRAAAAPPQSPDAEPLSLPRLPRPKEEVKPVIPEPVLPAPLGEPHSY